MTGTDLLRVTVGEGDKYTVLQDETGRLQALRYGEPWRDCCGDGLIYALASEVESLRTRQAHAINLIIGLLHDRSERYWGFRVTDCKTGKTVSGKANSGGRNNITTALTRKNDDWRRDYYLYSEQVREKELFALDYAGCMPEEIRSFVEKTFKL